MACLQAPGVCFDITIIVQIAAGQAHKPDLVHEALGEAHACRAFWQLAALQACAMLLRPQRLFWTGTAARWPDLLLSDVSGSHMQALRCT